MSGTARRDVDRLIFEVWTSESLETGDVELLVSDATSVIDPLDSLSTHILIRNKENKLVGYGRVAIAFDGAAWSVVPRSAEITDALLPLAYISRLVVDPAYRGQGIASMIHKIRIEIARTSGASAIYGWAVGEKPRASLAKAGFSEGTCVNGFATNWYTTARKTRLVRLNLIPHKHADGKIDKSLPQKRRKAL